MFNQKRSKPFVVALAFLAAGGVVLVDQLSKLLSQEAAVYNAGISFSLGEEWPLLTLAVTGFFLLLVILVSWQLLSERSWPTATAYGVLLGGGFSNLVDRWIFGAVRDIWSLPVLSLTNNLADWAIVLAAGYLVIREILPMYRPLWNRK